MESFLKELARQIYKENPVLDPVTVVFPNRRAALYFRKHLSEIIDKPLFAPTLITIEEFISSFSAWQVPDKLELIHRLHKSYQEVVAATASKSEPFDQFYFWGDMLLRDFDELDKYLINAEQLFKDLRNFKELDAGFDYLTEEQRKFLTGFWQSFEENLTDNKQKFIEVWTKLFNLYKTFKHQLEAEGIAFEGMLHRQVAETISSEVTNKYNPAKVMFAGFNALTKAEEMIVSYFVDRGSQVFWDGDEYYVNNDRQEAGMFFREYQQHPVLKRTYPSSFPSHFRADKTLRVFGSAQPAGQSKLMGQIIKEQLEKGMLPEQTLIVLPDEKLLMPVLYSIPEEVDKLNVTMGFGLNSTPFYSLIELLVELQIGKKKDHFNHRQVLAILGHPYVVAADALASHAKRKEILSHNWVFIPQGFLATARPLHRLVFGDMEEGLLSYITTIIREIGSFDSITDLDKEFAFQFIKLINRIQDVIGEPAKETSGDAREKVKSLKSFLRLLRQLVRAQKIPFSGEPLQGMQVMGVLETRNLDFKNVFILSLNEGAFPSFGGKGSYIPFNVRRAYGLPTVEHQDAIYAYLFYRVLQRAENIFLFYNTETDVLGQGEMSRYLQQLIFESGLKIEKQILHNPVQPSAIMPISITKTDEVHRALAMMSETPARFRGISPSAINTYIECRLKFYFRYVAHIKEPKEVEEDIDARVLGNFLHKVMERFYKGLYAKKKNKSVEQGDFEGMDTVIDQLIDEVFIAEYRLDPTLKVDYEGQRLIVKEIVKRFAKGILDKDKLHAPFVMEGIEQEGLLYTMKIDHAPGFAVIGGKIDRVDRKENLLRIIDYKTGKDSLSFDTVASLFARDEKRNKAAFQTLLYALLYRSNHPATQDMQLVPGLINRDYLFGDGTDFGLKMKRQSVENANHLLPEFELLLKETLEEIFDPNKQFDQTTLLEHCKFCSYKNICYR